MTEMMKRFLKGEITLEMFNRDDARRVLEWCEHQGLLWSNGASPLPWERNMVWRSESVTIGVASGRLIYSGFGTPIDGHPVFPYDSLFTDGNSLQPDFLF